MTRFVINKGADAERTVEAVGYQLKDGYWTFSSPERGQVLTVAADRIYTIEQA